MHWPDEDTTLPEPPRPSAVRAAGAWLQLSILFHPHSERIGEHAFIALRRGGNDLRLGRGEPLFSRAGDAQQEATGLGDGHISRLALRIVGSGERWRVLRPDGSCRCRLNGHEVLAEVALRRAELADGIRLLLAHNIVLHARLVDAEPDSRAAVSVPGLLGSSTYMQALRAQTARAAACESHVLLLGPTGTGKDVLARAIHAGSARADAAYVALNIAAIPSELAAATLFGAARGAYTGSTSDRRGYFEQADGGTLFLDEIGDAPVALQPQLLRALEQQEVQVVGGPVRAADVRVISATDANLDDDQAAFSSALRHRLGAVEIRLLPLAAHREDVGELLLHYLPLAFAEAGRRELWQRIPGSAALLGSLAETFDTFAAYTWPGNVRELLNVARQYALTCAEDLLLPADLARRMEPPAQASEAAAKPYSPQQGRTMLGVREAEFARAWAAGAYEIARVARSLGVSRQAVYRHIADKPQYRLARQVPQRELQAALAQTNGDLAQAAALLCVSLAGLRGRLCADRGSGVGAGAASGADAHG